MKKNRKLILGLMLVISSVLSGCGLNTSDSIKSENDSSKTKDESSMKLESENYEDKTQEDKDDLRKDNISTYTTSDGEGENFKSKDENQKLETSSEISSDTPILSDGKIVNFDKMQFAVNNIVYTLGETTLQDLIDDNVIFDERDIANAGNNLNPHTESETFAIVVGDYWSARICTLNLSDENKPISECVISEVSFPNRVDEKQNIIKFSFPMDLTREELIAQSGEPTEEKEHTYEKNKTISTEYKHESTVYYGDWGYEFEFRNGELDSIRIDYMP